MPPLEKKGVGIRSTTVLGFSRVVWTGCPRRAARCISSSRVKSAIILRPPLVGVPPGLGASGPVARCATAHALKTIVNKRIPPTSPIMFRPILILLRRDHETLNGLVVYSYSILAPDTEHLLSLVLRRTCGDEMDAD